MPNRSIGSENLARDRPDPGRPERSCACCHTMFRPTTLRSALRHLCYSANEAQWRHGNGLDILGDSCSEDPVARRR